MTDKIYILKKQCVGVHNVPNCAMLSVERIGDGGRMARPLSGVRAVLGLNGTALFREEWLRGLRDYSNGNSVGSRGVREHYMLEGETIYHVMSPTSWKSVDDYYCRVENCEIKRMTITEVFKWLNLKRR